MPKKEEEAATSSSEPGVLDVRILPVQINDVIVAKPHASDLAIVTGLRVIGTEPQPRQEGTSRPEAAEQPVLGTDHGSRTLNATM